MSKKLKKKLKKTAKKASLATQAEFSNASPMRGRAYAVKGAVYGW